MQNKPVRPRLWTEAVFEHVSDHNFVHMMSTCQMQQILAKFDLYHITSSTSSASIGSSGIKAHGINQTFNPPLLGNCNNSIANFFSRISVHSSLPVLLHGSTSAKQKP